MLVAVSLLAALLLAEGLLRLLDYSNPLFYIVDKDLGLALWSGAEGWQKQEGKAYVRINSDGLRDVEHSVQKPAGTVRIAVLGDSYAEGLQLPIEKLFWKILEEKVNKCLANHIKVEAINFGVSGYGTGRELLMLRKKVWKYRPDIVILAFLTGNDIRDNSKALNEIEYIPYFRLQNARLTLDRTFRESDAYKQRSGWLAGTLYRYINNVRLLQLANAIRQRWHERQWLARQQAHNGPGEEVGLDSIIYRPPSTPAWSEAWTLTEALIRQMNDEVREHGAHLLLVTLSNGIQVNPDREQRQKFMQRLGIKDLFYPDRRIIDFAKRNGIDTLMLGPELQKWAEKNGTCVHGFPNANVCGGHWNEYGHRLAGELMAKKLCGEFSK